MDESIPRPKWLMIRRDAKQVWRNITDDEWEQVNGRRDRLIRLLQERYGYGQERAGYTVNRFLYNMSKKYNH